MGNLDTLVSSLGSGSGSTDAGHPYLYTPRDPSKLSYDTLGLRGVYDKLFIATVQDVYTHLGHHVVGRAGGGSKIVAVSLMPSGSNAVGARNYSYYSPGTLVLCYATDRDYAVILGALPVPTYSSYTSVLSDFIATGAQSGFIHDKVHNAPIRLNAKTNGGLVNMSTGSPFDILPGDNVVTNEFGVGYGLGKLHAFMKSGDASKLEFHWLDSLVRLIAWNYEFFGSFVEKRIVCDEGENHYTDFTALYPWEAWGSAVKSTNLTKDGDADLRSGCKEGKYEPSDPNSVGIFRHQLYKGFLGDLSRELIMVPKGDPTSVKLSDKSNFPGVLDISKHTNGFYAVRSAKGVLLEKTNKIAVPKQIAEPDDAKSKSDAKDGTYKPSEAGDIKKKPWAYGEETPGIRAQQAWDFHSYMCNVAGLSAIANHKKDWFVPEEADVPLGNGGKYSPGYARLKTEFSLPLPTVANLTVDRRDDGVTKYYESRSYIELHDDGSVSIGDGYGAQIIMSGGHITFTAPGDIWTMPGRNAITWAPHDVINRAGNSVDITAGKKDVRIKAESNLHMLAGNSGTSGGVLIECRNKNTTNQFTDKEGEDVISSGIILKAVDNPVNLYGKTIYIRSSAGDRHFLNDDIVIDAGGGQASVITTASRAITSATDNFIVTTGFPLGPDDDKTSAALAGLAAYMSMTPSMFIVGGKELESAMLTKHCVINEEGSFIKSPLGVDGNLIANGHIYAQNNIIGDNLAQKRKSPLVGGGLVYNIDDLLFKEVRRTLSVNTSIMDSSFVSNMKGLGATLYIDNRPGNLEFISSLKFSLRNEDQYVSTGLKIYESNWQRELRASGTGTTWEEPVVAGPRGDTMPYPGRRLWVDDSCFAIVDNSAAYDINTGCSKTRASASSTGATPTMQKLSNSYLVVLQGK